MEQASILRGNSEEGFESFGTTGLSGGLGLRIGV